MSDAQQQGPRGARRIPPLWIRAEDRRGAPIDPRVVKAAQRHWSWAYRYVESELQDGAEAAEFLEQVALEVSARLQVSPEVSHNLDGYLITAFHHRVRSQVLKDNRLAYEGLLKELDENHQLRAPDWAAVLETELAMKSLLSRLPHEITHMLHYRMLELSWKVIGKSMGISAKRAKSRFYYGMQKAHHLFTNGQTKRAGQ